MICDSECGKLRVNVSGLDDALRNAISADREGWMGAIITVRSNTLLEPSKSNSLFSLFLPRFVERRDDKTTADDLDRIKAQFEAAMKAKKLVK